MAEKPLESTYNPPLIFKNPHINTIYPSIFRKIKNINYKRTQIKTKDNDFLELDWSAFGSSTLIIISHGLEGSSQRAYVKGMARALNLHGYDVLAWNYRTCGGKINDKLKMYHNGSIDDLDDVIQHCLQNTDYTNIFLLGFSMGGNISLLYSGKNTKLNDRIKGCIGFSVPCDLLDSSKQLEKFSNKIFMKRFLNDLHKKILLKQKQFPDEISTENFGKIKTFIDFDNKYTAPLHGFKNAYDYYEKCSCIDWLDKIEIPSLIVNAKDDPFLGKKCYPKIKTDFFRTEFPKYGGHVGFYERGQFYWSEKRALLFIKNIIN